jgi:Fur family peroxide stress response transcriptional regulator
VRYSKERELIYEALWASKEHPTADYLYNMLKAAHPSLSMGTVYRNLGVLVKSGKVAQLRMPDGPDRYDADLRPHYHAVCKVCGSVIDVFSEYSTELDAIIKKIEPDSSSYCLTLHRLCGECQKHC